jgi:putative membrane protein
MAYAVAAYLHFVAIFLLFALLVLEHQLFRQPLNFKRARSLLRADTAFGIVAGVVLVTGAARAMRYGKGMDYYLNNNFFHAKIGLFVLVALLSIYPTVTFLKWRPALKAGQVPPISPATARWVKTVIRIELLALLALPLLATLMARGFGVIAQ